MVKLSSVGDFFSGISSKPSGEAKTPKASKPATQPASGQDTGPTKRTNTTGVNLPPPRAKLDSVKEAFKGKTQYTTSLGPVQHTEANQSAGPAALINELNIDFPVKLDKPQLDAVVTRAREEKDRAMAKLDKAFDDIQPAVVPDPGPLNPKKSWALLSTKPKFNQTQNLRDAPPVPGAQVDSTARHALKHGSLQAAEEAVIYHERMLLQMEKGGASAADKGKMTEELLKARADIDKHRGTLIRQAAEARAELLSGLDGNASAALGRAFDRLDKVQIPEMKLDRTDGSAKVENHPAEDALNQTLLATTVKRVFSAVPADAAEGAAPVFDGARATVALNHLQNTALPAVLGQIDAVINGAPPSAMIELLEALGSQAGSPRRLAQLMGLPKSNPTDPADPSLRLKVAIDSLRAFNEAKRASPNGEVSEAQKAWLSNAVQYARHLVDPTVPQVLPAVVKATDEAAEKARSVTSAALYHTTLMVSAMAVAGGEAREKGMVALSNHQTVTRLSREADSALRLSGKAEDKVRDAAEQARQSAAAAASDPQNGEAAARASEDLQAWEEADGRAQDLRELAHKLVSEAAEEGRKHLEATSEAFRAAGSPTSEKVHATDDNEVQQTLTKAGESIDGLRAAGTAEVGAATQAKVAYRAVQNGLTTNEPGSAYDGMNKELQRLGTDLKTVRSRNVRRGTNVGGDVVNYVSSALPAWARGTKALAMRRKAVRNLVKTAVKTGMMLPLDQVLGSVHKNAAQMNKRIESRLEVLGPRRAGTTNREPGVMPLSPEELKEYGIGMAVSTLFRKTASLGKSQAKNMGPEVFSVIESSAQGHLEALGPEFMEEFKRMSQEGPNVGQLLALVAQHVDLEAMMATDVPLKLRDEPLTLKQRAARTEALTEQSVTAFQGLSTTLSQKLERASQERGEIEVESETLALEELKGLSAVAEAFAKRVAAQSPVAMRNHVPAFLFREVLVELGDRFPKDLAESWMELGRKNPDAGKAMRMLQGQIEAALERGPQGLRDNVESERKASSSALRDQQRQVHVERFRSGVADTVLSYADIREPRDFREMFDAVTSKIGTAEKLKFADSRTGTVDPLQLVTAMGNAVLERASISAGLSAGKSKTKDRVIDVNMHGGAMQVWIGKNESDTTSVGAKGGASLFKFKKPKVAVEAGVVQAKYEAGHESARFDGVGLRVDRKGGHEDWMRRDMAAIMGDLSDPDELMKRQKGLEEGDLIGALLNEHPLLIVDRIKQDKEADKGELGLTATLVRVDVLEKVRLPLNTGITRKTLGATTLQYEEGGATTVTERKVEGQGRVEGTLGIAPSELWKIAKAFDPLGAGGDKSKDEQPKDGKKEKKEKLGGGLVDSDPLGNLGVTQQLYGSGTAWVEREIRHGGPTGNTYANESKYSVETEQFNKYLRLLGDKDVHPILSNLAKFDTTPGRTDLEKFAVAEQRLRDTLEQFGKGAHPDVVFSVADALRESAGIATDAIEALAGESRRAGDTTKGDAFDQSLVALRMDTGSWTGPMLLMRSKAKKESGAGIPFVFTDKGAAEATRVQSMMPWTGERIGVHAGKAGMRPGDQSELLPTTTSEDNQSPDSLSPPRERSPSPALAEGEPQQAEGPVYGPQQFSSGRSGYAGGGESSSNGDASGRTSSQGLSQRFGSGRLPPQPPVVPEDPRGPSLQDLLNEPQSPSPLESDTERWYDVQDAARLDEEQEAMESLRQWRLTQTQRPVPSTEVPPGSSGPSLQDLFNQSPRRSAGPSLRDRLDEPESPRSIESDTERGYDVQDAELLEPVNVLRQWRLSMHTAVDAVAGPQDPAGIRQALQSELAAELVAAGNAGLGDEAALQQALAQSRADAVEGRRLEQPLRITERDEGAGPSGPRPVRTEVEGKGKAPATTRSSSSSSE